MKMLLNDSSALLNLLAADCLSAIAESTGWQFAICPAVLDEAKKLRDLATGEMHDVDLAPLIASGLLHVLELASEEEQTLYVEQAITVDDGEAMSIAIAATRKLELAIDDKQAMNHARRTFPELRLWTTPEILKHWSDQTGISAGELKRAIIAIESRARYFPSRTHTLAAWWTSAKA